MKMGNYESKDRWGAARIAAEIEQDLSSMRDYEGDSFAFYEEVRARAVNYMAEIRRYFGGRLFPEGVYAPKTVPEWEKMEWRVHLDRAHMQIDLLFKVMNLHLLTVDGVVKLLRSQ